MNTYRVVFSMNNREEKTASVEAKSIKAATSIVTDNKWYVIEEENGIKAINTDNVYKITVFSDEGLQLDDIGF